MNDMTHEEANELLGAYALGAMPQEEVAAMRAHILTCEECMRDADALTGAAAAFGLSAGTAPLPAGFSERILETARAERPQAAPASPRRRSWIPLLTTAVAVIVAIVATTAMITARSQLAREQRLLTAILHGEGFDLTGTSGAVAKIVATRDGSMFAATGLQEAPAGHDYQLWLIQDGEPTSAGTFDVSEGIAIVETDLSLEDAEAAAVTIEPDGGVKQPSGDPVLTSS